MSLPVNIEKGNHARCKNCGVLFKIKKQCVGAFCSRRCNYQNLTKFPRGRPPLQISRAELRELYLTDRLSTVAIARLLNVHPSTVHRLLKHFEIPVRNLSESHKGLHCSPNTEFTSDEMKALWKSLDWRRKNRQRLFESLHQKPNGVESELMRLLASHALPFKYNRRFQVEGLLPDFVASDGSKRCIDLFGRFYHEPFSPLKPNYKRCEWGRKAIFKSNGYDLMVVWEDELNSSEVLVTKIRTWQNNNFRAVGKEPMVYESAKITDARDFKLGSYITIGDFVFVHLAELIMGDGSQINPHACLTGGGNVYIGKHSVISFGARLITGTDNPRGLCMNDASPPEKRCITRGSITIGDNCFVGANAVIVVSPTQANVCLHDGCVIGSLTYVDRDVPAGTIAYRRAPLEFHPRKVA